RGTLPNSRLVARTLLRRKDAEDEEARASHRLPDEGRHLFGLSRIHERGQQAEFSTDSRNATPRLRLECVLPWRRNFVAWLDVARIQSCLAESSRTPTRSSPRQGHPRFRLSENDGVNHHCEPRVEASDVSPRQIFHAR